MASLRFVAPHPMLHILQPSCYDAKSEMVSSNIISRLVDVVILVAGSRLSILTCHPNLTGGNEVKGKQETRG